MPITLRRPILIGRVLLCVLTLALLNAPSMSKDVAEAKKPAPAPDMRAFFQMHYANRVQNFREQNQIFQNVVLVGDSITEGFDIAKFFPDHRMLNRGIGADVIGNDLPPDDKRGLLKRMDESFFDCSARDAFLLIGINDLGMGHTPEKLEAGYRDVLRQVKTKAPNMRVHIQSLFPTRDNYAKHNPNVLDFNQRLQKLAKEFDYDYIDLHSQLKDDKGELKKELTADGLHINAEGYKIWKAQIERTLGW